MIQRKENQKKRLISSIFEAFSYSFKWKKKESAIKIELDLLILINPNRFAFPPSLCYTIRYVHPLRFLGRKFLRIKKFKKKNHFKIFRKYVIKDLNDPGM